MGLSSSLYSGVSGLVTLGTSMQVIGDNIANVNTMGFKGSRATFQDILAQSINTARGGSQVGRGTQLADVSSVFEQGSFESTTSPTDLAIGGQGFFILSNPKVENSLYYTRAGQFHVDQYGYLVNPAGLRVQGWDMETQPDGSAEIVGAIKDIQISNSSPPVATDQATLNVNLDSRLTAPVSTATLYQDWNSTAGSLQPDVHFEYQTTFNIFDSLGTTHALTVYFDRTSVAADREWEFLVTIDPTDDRSGGVVPANAGMLMRGVIQFSPQGQIENIYGYDAADNPDPAQPVQVYNTATDTWQAATYGNHNYPQAVVFFQPPGAGWSTADPSAQLVEINLGAHVLDPTVSPPTWATEALTTTQYANRSSTLFYDQNGFAPGFLESVSVDNEGVISGRYSNGRIIALAQTALARFNSPTDLAKNGANLFTQTTASGSPITGQPLTNGLGSIASNALEQSTVDIGTEFVRLITTQRAFQANSRIITTTDDMLNELINMKR
ncbi:flagellar hook protein FlgE [Dissulfurirhabdus thermomarina]|uniref:Flagellar hook protein FlgE n=1 Tax=Dissulfurirhabdus thermomarina TaxID=1765737 RepID=A0A6N9TN59_DISTH|nr:flagellar hook protein FlgE [Dissulfurirhabdus thermomarina]NDY42579.1 flagellar hook protein FlgE [Dissulfurirhabdus thermomarina]NMX22512.1 flagellar hook protein FlgE [Dissulfurirhabdus thermomarina]